ncbi:MAG TPA: sulfite exporter TauE/SafE family protein [Candidatus Limnocylindrales bacterium]|nr:sulfite exporter TauE/SafE family protein [Candidatus Limnocylindrales bacterium]
MEHQATVEAMIAVAVSAWVQGSVGFGYALISAPLLALVAPELVPGPIMLSSLVLSLASAVRERTSIDRSGVALALLGRLPGVAIGAAALAWFSEHTTNVVFGVLVLVAVALSLSGLALPRNRRTLVTTGFVSGVMGTMTSIGGPPIALVYQHAEGPELRATLNTYFALGSAMSIPALALAGHFGRVELASGLLLLPATGVGFAMSGASRRYLDEGRTRGAVLAVASVSALAVVIRTLLV